jgi:hydroxymethylpyrimidine pyrophosphatase-like HAD family hydrolase
MLHWPLRLLMMKPPILILSTDFDGTLHAEFETPPVPEALQHLIATLQAAGMTWVINTGRDLSSLMETLGRAQLPISPDYVVTVEREIHQRLDSEFVPLEQWNRGCELAHERLFARIRPDVPRLTAWITSRFKATIYEDPFSPFCLIASNNPEADQIHAFLEDYCATVPQLTIVRNDVYARFSHRDYNKGSALAEIARRIGVSASSIVAAGDHLNDLPMLSTTQAKWLIAPGNAVPVVKDTVRRQGGYVSESFYGHGVAEGVRSLLKALHWPIRNG